MEVEIESDNHSNHDVLDFMSAVKQGETETVRNYLAGGSRLSTVDCRDDAGSSPLHIAAQGENSIEIVELLVKSGADVNDRNNDDSTPLHFATQGENKVDIVDLLLKYGAYVQIRNKDGWTPLHFAAQGKNHLEIVQKLLHFAVKGKNRIGIVNQLLGAGTGESVIDDTTILQYITENKNINGQTPLLLAVASNNLEIVKSLLIAGANIDSQDVEGNTALHLASRESDPMYNEMVEFLIFCGADTSIQNGQGQQAIDLAIQDDKKAIFNNFLEAGEEMGKSRKDYLLTKAFTEQRWDIVTILAGNGKVPRKMFNLDAEGQNQEGDTPLHMAVEDEDEDLVRFVLDNGPKSGHFIRNRKGKGKIPLDMAKSNLRIFRMVLNDLLQYANNTPRMDSEDKFHEIFGMGKDLFCIKVIDDTTILQYITDHNMLKEREDLLQLLKKIEEVREGFGSQKRVVKILRSGIKSSKGLKEAIASLKSGYSWSSEKVWKESIINVISYILIGGFLYIFDVYTDIKFSLEMFDLSQKNFTEALETCVENKTSVTFDAVEKCNAYGASSFECLEVFHNVSTRNIRECFELQERFDDPYQWTEVGIVSVAHILLPTVFATLIFALFLYNRIIRKDFYLPLIFPVTIMTKIYKAITHIRININNQNKDDKNFECENKKLMQEMEGHTILSTISMILEAGLESSFQFFFQGMYLFPTLCLAFMNVYGASDFEDLVNWKIISILLSFISFSRASFNIRNTSKLDALDFKNGVVLILKVLCDASSKMTIFGAFMFTHNGGQFSTKMTVTYYYGLVLVFASINRLFSIKKWKDVISLRNLTGNILNGLMSVLTFNSFDFSFMLGRVRKVDHKSTFWKQMSHTLIIFGVNLGFTISTALAMTNEMKLIDVNGKSHTLTKFDVGWMLGAGWILHLAALVLNYIYYKDHPSSPDISSEAIWKKLKSCNCDHLERAFLQLLWKIGLSNTRISDSDSDSEEEEEEERVSMVHGDKKKRRKGEENREDEIVLQLLRERGNKLTEDEKQKILEKRRQERKGKNQNQWILA